MPEFTVLWVKNWAASCYRRIYLLFLTILSFFRPLYGEILLLLHAEFRDKISKVVLSKDLRTYDEVNEVARFYYMMYRSLTFINMNSLGRSLLFHICLIYSLEYVLFRPFWICFPVKWIEAGPLPSPARDMKILPDICGNANRHPPCAFLNLTVVYVRFLVEWSPI